MDTKNFLPEGCPWDPRIVKKVLKILNDFDKLLQNLVYLTTPPLDDNKINHDIETKNNE